MAQQFQFGLDTFGDITLAPDGSLLTQAEVIRNVIEEGVHADAFGVDAFGVGEHHRPDFAVSAPEVVLAAIAGRTKRIRPYVDLYHRAFAEFGRPAKEIAVHSPGYVAATDEAAREEYWPAYKGMHDRIGAERGWPPIGRTEFDREVERGALHLGAPE